MQTIKVELNDRSYLISIGAGIFQNKDIAPTYSHKNILIVTNSTVAPLYLKTIQNLFNVKNEFIHILPDGEEYKNLASIETIFDKLIDNNFSRDSYLIALGGGVIGDMTGFAASCFQRGIKFIQIPTTLLSQVDSSVGGKTAVNHPLGKNMIGSFHQPDLVIIDTNCLETLPNNQFAAGMAEVIKYGIIWDYDFFCWLEQNIFQIKNKENNTLQYLISTCCSIKANVVSNDEKETGIRALLNLGHTFGHAIEAHMGYGNWLHGEAVAAGMVMAAKVALALNNISSQEFTRIVSLIESFDLPISAPSSMNLDIFMELMKRDKKVKNGKIRFIIPSSIGTADIVDDIPISVLESLFT